MDPKKERKKKGSKKGSGSLHLENQNRTISDQTDGRPGPVLSSSKKNLKEPNQTEPYHPWEWTTVVIMGKWNGKLSCYLTRVSVSGGC